MGLPHGVCCTRPRSGPSLSPRSVSVLLGCVPSNYLLKRTQGQCAGLLLLLLLLSSQERLAAGTLPCGLLGVAERKASVTEGAEGGDDDDWT